MEKKQQIRAPEAAGMELDKASEVERTQQLPPYNVVLLNDDEHTDVYVFEMLASLFGYPIAKSYKMAEELDRSGRVVVCTTHKELAELKRDQIHGFGPDRRIDDCLGSMSATIEPAAN